MSDEQDSSSSKCPDVDAIPGKVIQDSPYKLISLSVDASGKYGKLHLTKNVHTGEMVATKLARKNSVENLPREYEMFKKLGPAPGLPKVYFLGNCDSYDALVMELLGPSLDQVFHDCNSCFNIRTTTHIAIQMLEIITYVHSQGIIFCNVKPQNFCLGNSSSSNAYRIYMMGFNCAKSFENEQHQHIPKQRLKDGEWKGGMVGTPRFMSLHAHKCKELSRRDDLESIGYLLLNFALGKLPWQGLNAKNELDCYQKIFLMKKTIPLEDLCATLPAEFYHYMLYTRMLKFSEQPNYPYLIEMFRRLLQRIELEQPHQFVGYEVNRSTTRATKAITESEEEKDCVRKHVSFKEETDSMDSLHSYYTNFPQLNG